MQEPLELPQVRIRRRDLGVVMIEDQPDDSTDFRAPATELPRREELEETLAVITGLSVPDGPLGRAGETDPG